MKARKLEQRLDSIRVINLLMNNVHTVCCLNLLLEELPWINIEESRDIAVLTDCYPLKLVCNYMDYGFMVLFFVRGGTMQFMITVPSVKSVRRDRLIMHIKRVNKDPFYSRCSFSVLLG